MGLNVTQEVVALRRMTVPELARRYAEVFGEETRCRHKEYLWRRIIWRMQALQEGDLSDRAHRRAEELANDADLRIRAPRKTAVAAPVSPRARAAAGGVRKDRRLPIPGTVFADAFRRRQEIQALMLAVSKVKSTVLKAIEAQDPLFADVLASRFQADCGNVYRQLKAALPYAACPYCRAAGCKACHGRGWVGELAWNAAPREMKQ